MQMFLLKQIINFCSCCWKNPDQVFACRLGEFFQSQISYLRYICMFVTHLGTSMNQCVVVHMACNSKMMASSL